MSALTAAEPRWRVVMTDTESESGVAPICPEQTEPGGSHNMGAEFDDRRSWMDELSVFDCCPGPHIECWSPLRARQLMNLLNEIEAEICS